VRSGGGDLLLDVTCGTNGFGTLRRLERMPVTLSAAKEQAEILSEAKDDIPDPSPVRFREAFSPNVYGMLGPVAKSKTV
jgi:hypothetical protein